MSALGFPTNARWLDPYGSCVRCRKAAAGILMSDRNDRLGPYCTRCAAKAIANYKSPHPTNGGPDHG